MSLTLGTVLHFPVLFVWAVDATVLQLIATTIAGTAFMLIFHGHPQYLSVPVEGWPPDGRWWPAILFATHWALYIAAFVLQFVVLYCAAILVYAAWSR